MLISTATAATLAAKKIIRDAGLHGKVEYVRTPPRSHRATAAHVEPVDPEDLPEIAGAFIQAGYAGVEFSADWLTVQMIGAEK